MKTHCRGEYIRLLMDGKLNEYMHEVDEECHERIELLVEQMKVTAVDKKKIGCSSAEFLTVDEGLCVQIMHLGSFDSEPATVAMMEDYLKEQGFTTSELW